MPVVSHPDIQQPDDEGARIWRYMDFTKLIAMLAGRELYFAPIGHLQRTDPFEGSFLPSRLLGSTSKILNVEHARRAFRGEAANICVNCWHVSQVESAALWKLYAANQDGIALQSTCARLRTSLQAYTDDIHVGLVTYIDYGKETFSGKGENLLRACMHKRQSFAHENELRALIWPHEKPPGGLHVGVDLDRLIELIWVSPLAPDWVAELVVSVCQRYGLNAPVIRSQLLSHPAY